MEPPTFLKCSIQIDNCPDIMSACFFLSHHDHLGNPICDVKIFSPTNIHGYMFLGESIKRVYETEMTDYRGACDFIFVSYRSSGSLFKIIWYTEQHVEEENEIKYENVLIE